MHPSLLFLVRLWNALPTINLDLPNFIYQNKSNSLLNSQNTLKDTSIPTIHVLFTTYVPVTDVSGTAPIASVRASVNNIILCILYSGAAP